MVVLCLSPSHTLHFTLYAALLDLPLQPSATEVLGFGQTANASPSGLPFRFYEQSRRAPNDPTANRSVFASVDKVPGDQSPLPTHTASACTLVQRNTLSSVYASLSALNLDMNDHRTITKLLVDKHWILYEKYNKSQ